MAAQRYTARSTIAEIRDHPLGRDIIDRLLVALGRNPSLATKPLVGRLQLGQLATLARRMTGPGLAETIVKLLNATPDQVAPAAREPRWWQSAVVYQIYPRSFADSNGDGIGDLPGVIAHLDHLSDLGVDCIWLSPIFASPNDDFGYDVSDYRAVMTEMGTMTDIENLIDACHARGIRIILDLVVNHTSDRHPWFVASLNDPEGPFGDYYLWRRGDDSEPPNNWTSFFGGPAWRWFGNQSLWGLHLFAPSQPDLNWQNPQVRREVAEIMEFWRDKGVDGFRLDVINFISKEPGLPDGNAFLGQLMGVTGIEHYFHGPQLHAHLRELRDACGPDTFLVGETPGAGVEMARLLTGAGRNELDLVFNFDHLETGGHQRFDDYAYDLAELKTRWIDQQLRLTAGDWTALFFENHDNPRMISKIDPDPAWRVALAKLLAVLQLTMRGTPFIFQGQEIGAVNQDFAAPDQLRDVESLNRLRAGATWKRVMAGSRDHARVPMRWDTSQHTGFSTATPWLSGQEQSTGFTVAEQRDDPDSVLSFYKALIALRRGGDALTLGAIEFDQSRRRTHFSWWRTGSTDSYLIECNLSPNKQPARHRDAGEVVLTSAASIGTWLAPYEATIYRLPPDSSVRGRNSPSVGQ